MKRVAIDAILILALWAANGRPAAAQLMPLHVGFNGFFGAAPLYLARDAGIFRKQGFDLEMIFIAGGSLSTQALIGGSLDLLLTGGPPVINAHLRGARLKIIGGVTNILPYVLVTKGIANAVQLCCKKKGIISLVSNT